MKTMTLLAGLMTLALGCEGTPVRCETGEVRACAGCEGSVQTCDGEVWGPCLLPPERCDGIDNNCNGEVDEVFDVGGACSTGEGQCMVDGTLVCDPAGEDVVCDAVPDAPGAETCDGADEDCDGAIDEDVGRVQCYGGPAGTDSVGECRAGSRACVDGAFGGCEGEVVPAGERCGNGRDDDCDGVVDNPEICAPEPACGDGRLDAGEQCDDGNQRGGDGCRSDCSEAAGIQAMTRIGDDNVYFFSNGWYARYDVPTARIADNYPLPVPNHFSGGWPAGWSEVDASVNLGNGSIYFFKDRDYIRYEIAAARVVSGPQPIAGNFAGNWPGWDSVEAAVNLGNGSAYFFKGREYIRYDIATGRVANAPRPIAGQFSGNWPGWPDVDGAVNYGNGNAYFFRGDSYIRYDIAAGRIADGYPLSISAGFSGNWTPPSRW